MSETPRVKTAHRLLIYMLKVYSISVNMELFNTLKTNLKTTKQTRPSPLMPHFGSRERLSLSFRSRAMARSWEQGQCGTINRSGSTHTLRRCTRPQLCALPAASRARHCHSLWHNHDSMGKLKTDCVNCVH